MKKVIRIALTNWINMFIAYVFIFLGLFISDFIPRISTINTVLYNTFGGIIVYYSHFWFGFSLLLGLLDVLLFGFNKDPRYTDYKLIFEWVLISSPFIYWFIKYNQWIFLIGIIAFMIGQYIRRFYIFKILLKQIS